MHYLDLTIKDLHRELVAKNITPVELALEAIRRAKADDTNAFEYIMEYEAIEIAKKLVDPEVDNYLWGIPFIIKDNFSTKDIPTTGSSNILNGYIPLFDSTVYQKLIDAKAVPIGKTTLDELAMGGTGTTGHKGITYNPYDPTHKRIVGGSSCGSASGVANNIAPIGIGSDTGDSVRKPASYAGLVGIKPTWSRISRFGMFAFATSMDTVAYFTRSVFDSAVILNALAGRDENDATSSNKEVPNYLEYLDRDASGLKVAVIKEIIEACKDEDINKDLQKLLINLKNKGAEIEYISINKNILEAIYPTYIILSCAEATSNNACLDGIKYGPYYDGESYKEVMMKARTNGFSKLIKRRFVIGSYALMKENQEEVFVRAQKYRNKIVSTFNKIFEEFDFVIAPAAPTVAPKIDASSDKLSSEYLIAENFMAFANFGGYPSITVPLGLKKGLPYGVNITSKPFNEQLLFQIANNIEDITGLYNLNAKADN